MSLLQVLPTHKLPEVLASSLVVFLLSLFVIFRNRKGSGRLPLPPGPPQLPIIGNLHHAPRERPWKKYTEWSDKYGPIMTVQNGAATTIVITSWDIIKTHLERKNTIYSHRPPLEFFDRVNGGLNTSVMPYGNTWKAHRNVRSSVLKPSMAVKYRELQHVEITQLLHDLLSMEDFSATLRRCIASVFMTLAYGERVETGSDGEREVEELEEMNRKIALASEATFSDPSALLATLFPVLGRFSSQWKVEADVLHEQLTNILVKRTQTALRKPTWNWVKEFQANEKACSLNLKELALMVGSLYEASMAASQGLRLIIVAAILFPEAAARVHEELDRVVGTGRLPNFDDRDSLPWTNAFIKETIRWRSLTPLGSPRAAFEDDECMGYRIPRGATILTNLYALDHDAAQFPDPWEIKPERWIENPDLPQLLYGFGQRGCPGRHMGGDSLFLGTARLFWAFQMEPGMENGRRIKMDKEKYLDSLNGTSIASFVPEFRATFTPRSAQHQNVIEEQWKSVRKDSDVLLADIMPTATCN